MYLEDHPALQEDVVRGSDLQHLVDERVDIPAEFVSKSIARGDWCHLFRDGADIASYTWSTKQTCPVVDNVVMHFSSDYRYTFKSFTVPAYRGQHLLPLALARLLTEAVKEEHKGLVGYVEAHNASSLKSTLRLGYRIFGTCFLIRVLGHAFTLRTPGCRHYGFYLGTTHPES